MDINHIGIGIKSGQDRARLAAEEAVSSPLLGMALENAANIMLFVKGGDDMSLMETHYASKVVRDAAPSDAEMVFDSMIDREIENEIRVTVIVTKKQDFAEKVEAAFVM